MDTIVKILIGESLYNVELRTFGMAFQGAMTIRNGRNKDKSMDWFYAFSCTLLTAFAGGLFGFMWMGKPTSLITGGDITLTLTAIAFVLATYTPLDIGFKLGNNVVVKIFTTVFAQLFRALGMISFINTATAEVSATKYYPTPILGPVLYGVLLGNMGAFFSKGFDGHLQEGVPFPIQNGRSCLRLVESRYVSELYCFPYTHISFVWYLSAKFYQGRLLVCYIIFMQTTKTVLWE
jgi:hypothetical protein